MRSPLEEKWTNLVEPPLKHSEMTIPVMLELLRKCDFYDDKVSASMVKHILTLLTQGKEVVCIAQIESRRSRTISPLQFMAVLHWVASRKGITYAECVAKLVNHPNGLRTAVEQFFNQFAQGSCKGLMTVPEFVRFCLHFELFSIDPKRFVAGDVHTCFIQGGEGKGIDYQGFRRVLGSVADRLQISLQDLIQIIASKKEAPLAAAVGPMEVVRARAPMPAASRQPAGH